MTELVLHIGMPKTGTSALQDRLKRSRRALLDQGILYPDTGTGRTHAFLAFTFAAEGKVPRLKLARMNADRDRMTAAYQAGWATVAREIAEHRPARVILTSEHLFGRVTAENGTDFRDRVNALFDTVKVVAYIRQPSRAYYAKVQQRLKFSGYYPAPAAAPLRRQLEGWDSLFPGSVRVFGYDRALLAQGDITEDFAARCLGGADLGKAGAAEVNISLSAEAVAIQQEFQRRFLPGAENRNTWQKKRLKKALARADRVDPPPGRPALRPEISTWLDTASVDLLWLRDHHGLVFPDLDYAAIHAQPEPQGAFDHVSEVFPIDPARKARLEAAVFGGFDKLALYRRLHRLLPAPKPKPKA